MELVKGPPSCHHPLYALLVDIQSLLDHDWRCTISHVLHEANSCADYLAKQGACQDEFMKIYHRPPMAMSSMLQADFFNLIIIMKNVKIEYIIKCDSLDK